MNFLKDKQHCLSFEVSTILEFDVIENFRWNFSSPKIFITMESKEAKFVLSIINAWKDKIAIFFYQKILSLFSIMQWCSTTKFKMYRRLWEIEHPQTLQPSLLLNEVNIKLSWVPFISQESILSNEKLISFRVMCSVIALQNFFYKTFQFISTFCKNKLFPESLFKPLINYDQTHMIQISRIGEHDFHSDEC